METKRREMKILFFPWLAYGHVSPYFELARRLSTKPSIKTYLCSTQVNLTPIQNRRNPTAVELIPLPVPPSSSELPPEQHTTKNLPPHLLPKLAATLNSCESNFTEVLSRVKPDVLVYDLMQLWSAKAAQSMGIHCVFMGHGATFMSYYHHVYTHGSGVDYPFPAIKIAEDEKFDPRAIRAKSFSGVENEFFGGVLKLSTGVAIFKSYGDVEAKHIDYLSELCGRKVLPAGPLIAESDYDNQSSEIVNWLDGKTPASTVYVSFGSEYIISGEETRQLASGLELSGVNFLWVYRSSSETPLQELLPEGFSERTSDRGMIVTKWAPQTAILTHRSIAAFVSHCGWGSLTESLYFGIPVIAMQMKQSDWPINAALMVECGAGVPVDRKEGIYTAEGIAKAINGAVSDGDAYRKLKDRAVELSKEIRDKEESQLDVVATELAKLRNLTR